jgi:4-diphosphocytidyl-2-C-methyl-D-erythritol kinase
MLSPAKVNLGLKILYKRTDGYHELESFFLRLDWGDEIYFEALKEERFELHSQLELDPKSKQDYLKVSETGDISKNILHKAWLKAREMGFQSGLKIHLKKRIPTGGGLGGGSSNAASLFRFAFPLAIGDQVFLNQLSKIGADVPFFWKSQHQYVRGIGEILEDVFFPRGFGVLALPGFVIPTKDAFFSLKKALHVPPIRESWKKRGEGLLRVETWKDFFSFIQDLKNDFEPFACSLYPDLGRLRKSMLDVGFAYVSMSGTGSSFYGLTDSQDLASEYCKFLKVKYPHYGFVVFGF